MKKKLFKIKGGLAEALDETVSSAKNNAGDLHIEIIPIRKIFLDPKNPRNFVLGPLDLIDGISKDDENFKRKHLEKKSLRSLAKSINEQGVMNPVVVYKSGISYQLVAGERRTLASILAKKEDIPARIISEKPDKLKLGLIQWVENMEREDLSLWERLRNLDKILLAYAKISQKTPSSVTPTDLCGLLGCSLQQAVNYRHLLNAPKNLRAHIENSSIKNIEKVAFIVKLPFKNQDQITDACIKGASLSDMKKLLERKTEKSSQQVKKIDFGCTKSKAVAKVIIDSVLGSENFKHLKNEILDICWEESKSISKAFKKLVKLIEGHSNDR